MSKYYYKSICEHTFSTIQTRYFTFATRSLVVSSPGRITTIGLSNKYIRTTASIVQLLTYEICLGKEKYTFCRLLLPLQFPQWLLLLVDTLFSIVTFPVAWSILTSSNATSSDQYKTHHWKHPQLLSSSTVQSIAVAPPLNPQDNQKCRSWTGEQQE